MPKLTPHERSIKALEKANERIDARIEVLLVDRKNNDRLIEQLRKEAGGK